MADWQGEARGWDEDTVLLRAILEDGQREAFGQLVLKYQDRLLTLALRITGSRDVAQDLVQDAFLKAYTYLPQFKGRSRFSSWLWRIAINCCKDHLKSKAVQATIGLEGLETGWGGEVGNPEHALEVRELEAKLQAAILALPPKYRVPFCLKHVEGLSYEEMQEVLKQPIHTLKIRVYRAREKLQRLLEKELD